MLDYNVSLSPESFELLQILGRSPGFPDFRFTFSSQLVGTMACGTKALYNKRMGITVAGTAPDLNQISPVFPFNLLMS
jgi:hypothetical protein